MLMITHDLGVVGEVCDKVAVMYAGSVIERGSVRDVYSNMCHPYTIGLFGSVPNLDENTDRLKPIAGLMPDPSDLPKGCAFSPRCPYASEKCKADRPVLDPVSPGHSVACFNYKKVKEGQ